MFKLSKSIMYFTFVLVWVQISAQTPLPKVSSGKIIRIENFQSRYTTERNVDIWLPQAYKETSKYAVLYMHDGQMLYDPELTWNQQAWHIDKVASKLWEKDKMADFIVVGIWNDGKTRHSDYFPQKPFDALKPEDRGGINAQSDNYLKFLVEELKPYVDSNFSVYKDREHTYVMGSSMGGLISLYALCEYPNLFGGAACMSTHWVGTYTLENNPIPQLMLDYLDKHLPAPNLHKIYFDCGDQTLDSLYTGIQTKVDSLMYSKGYDKEHWITRYFPGEDHSERAWSKRLHLPLEFLFLK
jgi:predicted alpha/beta superfamily hydrolase